MVLAGCGGMGNLPVTKGMSGLLAQLRGTVGEIFLDCGWKATVYGTNFDLAA
jgi:hypothetical protein